MMMLRMRFMTCPLGGGDRGGRPLPPESVSGITQSRVWFALPNMRWGHGLNGGGSAGDKARRGGAVGADVLRCHDWRPGGRTCPAEPKSPRRTAPDTRRLGLVAPGSPSGIPEPRNRHPAHRACPGHGRGTGVPLLFLEGSPDYYGKRGFERADEVGFRSPSRRIPAPAFQVARLSAYEPWMTGTLVYSETFWALDCVGLRDPEPATADSSHPGR